MKHDFDTEHLLDLLSCVGACRARRMFGGLGIFLGPSMIGLVIADVFYLKTDVETKARFAAAGGRPFTYDKKTKQMVTSYYTPPEQVFESSDDMRPWAKLAVDAARRAATRKSSKQPAAKKRSTKTK